MLKTVDLPGPFRVNYPEVYQLELCSGCQLSCKMCPRKEFTRRSPRSFLLLDTVDKLLQEDSFRGSYFLELQMSGEPLLHPHFTSIVDRIKNKCPDLMLGLSTNGMLIKARLDGLKLLDYITISVDSLTDYENIRVGGDMIILREGIGLLLDNLDFGRTSVDLQLVELDGWQRQLESVKNVYGDSPLGIRTVPDCFRTVFEEADAYPVKKEPCVNPWWSVSIQSNGNVVPCCFSFGDDIVYGNIEKNSLDHIWHTSPIVKNLREIHSDPRDFHFLPNLCKKCYMRSPAFLHWNIYINSLKNKMMKIRI